MDAPSTEVPRRFSRRRLLKLAGAAAGLALSAEAARVLAFTNKHTVIPGKVYRSAQLGPEELTRFVAEKKVRTVVNLRGVGVGPDGATGWYLGECRATHAAGVSQEDITLSAKNLPAPDEVRRVVEVLDHAEKPLLLHCQQGADRTGLVATAYLLLYTDATLPAARRQLWPRYGHFAVGRTAAMDQFFDLYEAWLGGRPHAPDLFRRWATAEYCPGPYRAELTLLGPNPPEVPTGRGFALTVRVANRSPEPWAFKPGGTGAFWLRYELYADGRLVYPGRAGLLAAAVPPGGSIDLACGFPPVPPGRYIVNANLIDAQAVKGLDADFAKYGSEPLGFDVVVK